MFAKTRITQWFQRKNQTKTEDTHETHTPGKPDMIVRISDLNQYAYCPRRAWYVLIAGEHGENAHLVEGAILHKRADSAEHSTPRKGVKLPPPWPI